MKINVCFFVIPVSHTHTHTRREAEENANYFFITVTVTVISSENRMEWNYGERWKSC